MQNRKMKQIEVQTGLAEWEQLPSGKWVRRLRSWERGAEP